jgi:proteasome assembly chaperone (PAC2) family protein
MDPLVDLWETPEELDNYMIAGWGQWADAGETSSSLPDYLVEALDARKIGEIREGDFYLFQIPGTHHLLRPEVKLKDGYRQEMSRRRNEIYYAEVNGKGLVIFRGEEPHMNEERYAEAFFDVVEALGIKRVIALAGVFGAMPYAKDREISCIYSLPDLKSELDNYAVRYSNYGGGTTIGAFLSHRAEYRNVEFVRFCALVPAYEFSTLAITVQSMRVEQDWKAWYDVMRRIDYMFDLNLDLSDLELRARELIDEWDEKIEEIEQEHPDYGIKAAMMKVAEEFTERPFIPLDDAWNELGDLLENMDDGE